MVISGLQIAAARAMLDMRQKEFAKHLSISAPTLCVYENGLKIPPHRLEELINVFKDRGISFINSDEGQGIILSRNGRG